MIYRRGSRVDSLCAEGSGLWVEGSGVESLWFRA